MPKPKDNQNITYGEITQGSLEKILGYCQHGREHLIETLEKLGVKNPINKVKDAYEYDLRL